MPYLWAFFIIWCGIESDFVDFFTINALFIALFWAKSGIILLWNESCDTLAALQQLDKHLDTSLFDLLVYEQELVIALQRRGTP